MSDVVQGIGLRMLVSGSPVWALGLAAVIDAWAIGRLLNRWLYSLLIVIPLIMAGVAFMLMRGNQPPLAVGLLLAVWGLVETAAPVAWWTWLSKTLPNEAEAGGGLMVAMIQLAIAGAQWAAACCMTGLDTRARLL